MPLHHPRACRRRSSHAGVEVPCAGAAATEKRAHTSSWIAVDSALRKVTGRGKGKRRVCALGGTICREGPQRWRRRMQEKKMKRTPTFHCLSLFHVQCTARWQIEAHSSSPHLSTPRINSARGLLRTRNENCVASHENSIEPR